MEIDASHSAAVRSRIEADGNVQAHRVNIKGGSHEWVHSQHDKHSNDTIVDTWAPGHTLVSQYRIHDEGHGVLSKSWRTAHGQKSSYVVAGTKFWGREDWEGSSMQNHSFDSLGGHNIECQSYSRQGVELTEHHKFYSGQHVLQEEQSTQQRPDGTVERATHYSPAGKTVHNKVRHGHHDCQSVQTAGGKKFYRVDGKGYDGPVDASSESRSDYDIFK